MNITIRPEQGSDDTAIYELIAKAFQNKIHSDHDKQNLVNVLCKSSVYIPELTLVAMGEGSQLVGNILLTRATIEGKLSSLALAPVSVQLECQRREIGSMLIREAHQRTVALGYGFIILMGHKEYYPCFGYKPLSAFNIRLPFEVSEEFCMVMELMLDALENVNGVVIYSKAFNS
ncbi:MAG: N-acetyltransferase [Bacteroidales bacterium]